MALRSMRLLKRLLPRLTMPEADTMFISPYVMAFMLAGLSILRLAAAAGAPRALPRPMVAPSRSCFELIILQQLPDSARSLC